MTTETGTRVREVRADDITKVVAELFGEAFDNFRVTGAKVVFLTDIVGDVEQFFLASAVIVNQFPVAIADRTVTKVYKKVGFLQI